MLEKGLGGKKLNILPFALHMHTQCMQDDDICIGSEEGRVEVLGDGGRGRGEDDSVLYTEVALPVRALVQCTLDPQLIR